MNVQFPSPAATLKFVLLLTLLWLAYQKISAPDFSAPSDNIGTAPAIR